MNSKSENPTSNMQIPLDSGRNRPPFRFIPAPIIHSQALVHLNLNDTPEVYFPVEKNQKSGKVPYLN
jgi:hypothetical protein